MAASVKCIVVHISDDRKHGLRLRVAVELARRFHAHLNAVYAKPPVTYPAVAVGRTLSMNYLDEETEKEQQHSIQIRREVAEVCKDLPSWEWHQHFGDVEKIIARYSHLADLVIAEQTPRKAVEQVLLSDMTNILVRATGCPLLLLPWEWAPAPIGTRILISWQDSREASAALRVSMDFLRQADQVLILVSPEMDTEIPGADIVRYLKCHDVHGKVIGSSGGDGHEILETAYKNDCDLLVMGAFVQSRVRELLLGRVTDTILRDTTIPVLMRH
jgi:nucleotide-binding universal stress UspA family protein